MSATLAAGEVGLGRLIELDPTPAESWAAGGAGSVLGTARVAFVRVRSGRWSPDPLPSSPSRPCAAPSSGSMSVASS